MAMVVLLALADLGAGRNDGLDAVVGSASARPSERAGRVRPNSGSTLHRTAIFCANAAPAAGVIRQTRFGDDDGEAALTHRSGAATKPLW